MKHEISRLSPVFLGPRYIGCFLKNAKGYDAYNVNTKVIGTYSSPEQAAGALRRFATNECSECA
jgi:hypothetical protein